MTYMLAWSAAVVLSLLPLPGTPDEGIVTRPEYRVGDAWTYERLDKLRLDKSRAVRLRYTDEVVRVSDAEIEIHAHPAGRRGIFTPDLNILQLGTVRYKPLIALRRFPLRVGDTWKERYDFQPANAIARPIQSQLSGEVLGWESVTVPAGTFRCLKILVRIHSLGMGSKGVAQSFDGDETRTECWSPDVKWFVRMEYQSFWAANPTRHDIFELIEFKPGR